MQATCQINIDRTLMGNRIRRIERYTDAYENSE